jgi:hypothetical protein
LQDWVADIKISSIVTPKFARNEWQPKTLYVNEAVNSSTEIALVKG